jgi:predicted secreted protein with PEFG-CTERM motif
MITHLKVFALLAIMIAGISGSPVFGQIIEPIAVTTDKDMYANGETIIVSGEVKDLLSGYQISLQVFEPRFQNRVSLEQIGVNPDKTFSVEITAGGPLWRADGTYTIKVLYGTESRTAETTFEFSGSGVPLPKPTGPTIEVGDTGAMIGYSIKGGSVLSITEDFEAHSLIVKISTTSDGELTITLPRNVIDSKIGNDDDIFFVLIDGEEWEFTESKTSTDRTLTIPFPDGAEEIEIIGTVVIPEFGTIAALILAVAIVSIIAVTAKTRLTVLPKY